MRLDDGSNVECFDSWSEASRSATSSDSCEDCLVCVHQEQEQGHSEDYALALRP